MVLIQCFIAFILLIGATIFEFALHYTHFYLVLFSIATFLFYATLFIVLKLGAVGLPDVAILQRKMNPIFIVFGILTLIVGLNGAIRHDYSAWCIPYTYFPLLEVMKLLNLIWNLISIGVYLKTIKYKS